MSHVSFVEQGFSVEHWGSFIESPASTIADAHPQMRALVTPLLDRLQAMVPVVFDDIRPS